MLPRETLAVFCALRIRMGEVGEGPANTDRRKLKIIR